MSFTALIEDLEALQKAKATPEPDGDEGDDKIRAAAGEEAAEKAEAEEPPEKKAPEKKGEPDGDEDDMDEGDDDGDEEGENPVLGKSFGVTLDDGTEVEAYDATEILKSFDARLGGFERELSEIDLLKAEIAELKGREVPSADAIKAEVEKVLAAQNTMLKSLQEQVAALSAQGQGRKSTLNVHEKPGPAGAEARPETPSGEALMTKALIAQKQGRITGQDVARLDAYLGRGLQAPPEILARLT